MIRRGKLSYNVLSAEETQGKFNAQHIQLRNIIANISLKALQNDSINAAIKRLSIEEGNSGFELKRLSLKVVANDQKMNIENFAIDLPNTSLAMDTIRMEYDSLGPLAILLMMFTSRSVCCLQISYFVIWQHLFPHFLLSKKSCK